MASELYERLLNIYTTQYNKLTKVQNKKDKSSKHTQLCMKNYIFFFQIL